MRLVIHYEEVNVTGKDIQSAEKMAVTGVFSVHFSDFLERSAVRTDMKELVIRVSSGQSFRAMGSFMPLGEDISYFLERYRS